MLLKDKESDNLVKITQPEELYSPAQNTVTGRTQAGEEEQGDRAFQKQNLIFPSGESLPRCWVDAEYRQ